MEVPFDVFVLQFVGSDDSLGVIVGFRSRLWTMMGKHIIDIIVFEFLCFIPHDQRLITILFVEFLKTIFIVLLSGWTTIQIHFIYIIINYIACIIKCGCYKTDNNTMDK